MVSVAVTSCANSPAAKKDGGLSSVVVPEASVCSAARALLPAPEATPFPGRKEKQPMADPLS